MYLGFLDDTSFRWDADRTAAFDSAKQADASVVRTIVRWCDVAPSRPARAADPWDPAYDFSDVDEFVRNAQQRGLEVLLTVWGTPGWANGGRAPNVPPADSADLTAFAHALASRYSGTFPGYPFARFFSVWNEPNSPRFLAAADAPAAYASLAAAAYEGLKQGSPQSLVAVGETAARHAPAAFMAAVARARPGLRFDAWAHHPYPPTAAASPDRAARWPGVGLRELGRFGNEIDLAFGRARVPVWVTEYAESTTSVPAARQAADLARALELAARASRVEMFVWLMLRDHDGEPWQSGVLGKPAYEIFRRAAGLLDARNARVQIDTRTRSHLFHVAALELKWHIPTAERVGMRYTLRGCGRTLQSAMPAGRIAADGWVPLQISFRPQTGVHYALDVMVEDIHGFRVHRTLELVGVGPPTDTPTCVVGGRR
jgi:Cellulase (glycosyl hydrolase family 5)